MNAYEAILERLGEAVVRRNGNQAKARCPIHDDRRASLSIGVGTKGDPCAVLCCQAGCETEAVLAAMGLEAGALYDSWWEPSRNGSSWDPVAVYSYANEDGEVLFEVGRFVGKRFFQRRPGRSDWKGGIEGVRRVLYRLPQVIEAVAAGRRVWIVEGEEDVHALERLGEVATCNPGGAGNWRQEYRELLRGASAVIVADADKPGREHARDEARSLAGVVAGMDVVESPYGKDVRDHLRAGHGLDEFEPLAEPAEPSESSESSGEVAFIRASSVKPANVRWAWRGWLPLGMLSLLIGLPGRGKTTLAEQLAADVTRGRLEGGLHGRPSNVLIVSYEDAIAETLVPRLIAAEADLDRIEFIACKQTGHVLDLTRHLSDIERRAVELEVRLLVIDPLVAGMPRQEVNSHRDQDVRSVLAPLASLADRCGLSAVATMHFSKAAVSALLGAGGSVGFVAAARSILVFGLDPRDELGAMGPKRILAHAKCNVAKLQRSRELLLAEHIIDPFGPEPITTSRIEIGEACDVPADDLVRDVDHKISARVQAQRFLRELLADGPHRAKEVIELAEAADIGVKTLYRAKDDLDVASMQRKSPDGKPEWWWVMPEEEE